MRVDQTTDRLLRAQRTAETSEQIGREIIGALEEDREVLERAKGKVICNLSIPFGFSNLYLFVIRSLMLTKM